MIPSLLSDEFQAAVHILNDAAADTKSRDIATGAIARMEHPDIDIPNHVTLDWRRGYIDPSLPMRLGR